MAKECYYSSDLCLHVARICSNKHTKKHRYLKISCLMRTGEVYMTVLILLKEPTMGLWQPQSPQALYSPGRRKYWRPL